VKILIADSLHEQGVEIFRRQGFELDIYKSISAADLAVAIKGVDGLVIRSATKVTSALLEQADRLKVVGRAGTGLDNVDIPAASARKVAVMNTPGQNSNAVAELAFAYVFALSRHLPQANSGMHAGRWEKKTRQGSEVKGKTLGIVGLGSIGRILAKLAASADMRVTGLDPFLSAQQIVELGVQPLNFDELLRQSDFISIHVPKTKETTHLFNAANIAKMKSGAYLINCARGGIVDEKALCAAVAGRRLAGAALDVFEQEPLSADSPILGLENILCTPHLGADTYESQINVAVAVARQMSEYLKTGQNQFVLNP
jgi:D-3-phosphoglycerate dehydrogenase